MIKSLRTWVPSIYLKEESGQSIPFCCSREQSLFRLISDCQIIVAVGLLPYISLLKTRLKRDSEILVLFALENRQNKTKILNHYDDQ